MPDVLQRLTWCGTPFRMDECFHLQKGSHQASCQLWSHQFGWELRLELAGELHRSQVCRSQEDVFNTIEEWKAALVEKGWT